jgi:hypothetical protein
MGEGPNEKRAAKKTLSNPQWIEFVSACRIKSEIREDVMFRAQYWPARAITDEEATIVQTEQFNAAICGGPHRILAIDTDDTPHDLEGYRLGRLIVNRP